MNSHVPSTQITQLLVFCLICFIIRSIPAFFWSIWEYATDIRPLKYISVTFLKTWLFIYNKPLQFSKSNVNWYNSTIYSDFFFQILSIVLAMSFIAFFFFPFKDPIQNHALQLVKTKPNQTKSKCCFPLSYPKGLRRL